MVAAGADGILAAADRLAACLAARWPGREHLDAADRLGGALPRSGRLGAGCRTATSRGALHARVGGANWSAHLYVPRAGAGLRVFVCRRCGPFLPVATARSRGR